MNNKKALQTLCTAMVNTFYPDESVLEFALSLESMNGEEEQIDSKDPRIFALAVTLIYGYVEQSRSEGGISTSVKVEAIINSIKHWAKIYGLDADEYIDAFTTKISDGTNLW